MKTDTSEKGLETLIMRHLTGVDGLTSGAPTGVAEAAPAYGSAGWFAGHSAAYDREYAVDTEQLFTFLRTTQPDEYAKLGISDHRDAKSMAWQKFLARLQGEITRRGVIDVLRKGIKHGPLNFDLFYGAPSADNAKAVARHAANRFSITRQLYYSREQTQRALDLCAFINGLPLITFELKNSLTKQTVDDAVEQYKRDRDPRETLFAFGRCLVHFAVDDSEVRMCTALKGAKGMAKDSWFLPFNQGWNDGAGNPPNPDGLKTDYLWKRILTPARLTEILENYAQIVEEVNPKTGKKKQVQIFPRYHQLDVVRRALADVQEHGAGQRYLIQHSAGSGKSNSIAWLAHQLIGLRKDAAEVFDSIIVITDRRLLDQQIRQTIKGFAQVGSIIGAVKEGAGSSKTEQLAKFLKDGKKLIISTVQTFPFVLDRIGEAHRGGRFAIIIDEAHSSQGGRATAAMNMAIVAFSGEPEYHGEKVSEAKLNGFPGNDIAERIQEDPYRFLICADKFQTGYDEPLLHTLYVDKSLWGIKAVQTLSRLNRAHPQKSDVFVLDFQNDIETIEQSFADYYRTTILSRETDPNKLHTLKAELDQHQVYSPEQIDAFVALFLDGAPREKLDPILDACVAVYVNDLDEDQQVDFKSKAKTFTRTYDFLATILPYGVQDWEKLSIFLNFLISKLPAPVEEDLAKGILDAIDMDSYRAEKKAMIAIALPDADAEIEPAPTGGGGRKPEPELDKLSNIVKQFNDQFGGLFLDSKAVEQRITEVIPPKVAADPAYQNALKNTPSTARIEHDKALKRVITALFKDDAQLFKQFQDNASFRNWLTETVFELTCEEVENN